MYTPLDALRLEVDTRSYNTFSNRLILRAQEKALRMANDHPKGIALADDIPQRFQNCCSFHRKTNDLSTLLPAELEHCQIIIHFLFPPWQLSTPRKEQISTPVPVTGRVDDIDLKPRRSLTLTASYQINYTIYTDQSASEGTRSGGAAAVIPRGSPV